MSKKKAKTRTHGFAADELVNHGARPRVLFYVDNLPSRIEWLSTEEWEPEEPGWYPAMLGGRCVMGYEKPSSDPWRHGEGGWITESGKWYIPTHFLPVRLPDLPKKDPCSKPLTCGKEQGHEGGCG